METAELHYEEAGQGTITLLFLHYFGGAGQTWAAVIASLSNSYRCVAVDLPGFGASPPPTKPPTVEDCADDLERIIIRMGLGRYALIGHSMGGKVALALAARQPTGLISLVLVAPSPPTPEPMTLEERQKMRDLYGQPSQIEAHLQSISAAPLSPALLRAEVACNLMASQQAWNAWLDIGSKQDISARMEQVRVPALVVAGAADTSFTPELLERQVVGLLPKARLAVIAEAGHLIPLEQPEALATLIRQWVGV